MGVTAPATGRSQGWLFGATPDLWLGCGLAYLLVALMHLVLGASLVEWVPAGLLILVFSMPHYGATLLRVYEAADDRAKYRLFAVHATGVLVLCLAVGSHLPILGSLLLTIYLTWSPWHYSGQNYGVGLMLLARRGVTVDSATKRAIYTSFLASFALTFIAIHGETPGASYAPVSYDDAVYRVLPLGIPTQLGNTLLSAAAVVWAVSLAVSLGRLLRAGGGRSIAPFALVVATQAMWFSIPVLLRLGGVLTHQPGPANPFSAYGFVWVAAAHAAQYLWITTYFATAGTERGRLQFLRAAALSGFAVWTLPGLLFAPGLLGGVAYDSGLALLIASVVNLHHFILDGAIWKLRDGAVSRVLLRPVPERDHEADSEPSIWPKFALVAAGSLSIAIAVFGFWQSEFGYHRPLARGDVARAEQTLDRFAWIARDGAAKRTEVGRRLAEQGNYARARMQLERSLAVEPSAIAHHWLGLVHEHLGAWEMARDEYTLALSMDSSLTRTLERRAIALVELGDPQAAIQDLESARALAPLSATAQKTLVRARIAARR